MNTIKNLSAEQETARKKAHASLNKRTVLRSETLQEGDVITIFGTNHKNAAFFDTAKSQSGQDFFVQPCKIVRNGKELTDDRHKTFSVNQMAETIRTDNVEGVAEYQGANLEPRWPQLYELLQDQNLETLESFPSKEDITFTVVKKDASVAVFLDEKARKEKGEDEPRLLKQRDATEYGTNKTVKKYVYGLYTRKSIACSEK